MTSSLMVFNTTEPGSIVHVPYLPNEPVFYIVDRISSILTEDRTQVGGRKLFVNGVPIHDMSKSVELYRILGNAFSYRTHPRSGYSVFVMTLTSKSLFIPCDPEDTAKIILQRVEDLEGTPAHEMRLIYAGKQLDNTLSLSHYQIEKNSVIHLLGRLRGGGISLGIRFPDVSDNTSIRYLGYTKNPLPGRYSGKGTNIEGLCDCHKGKHRVICKQGYGITEMTTVKFECPLCHSSRVAPVTVGFAECKFRVHGIKMCGDQCTTEWTTVTREDRYALFDPAKQTNWRRLMIESVALDGSPAGERCLMCLLWMDEQQELECGHHYHPKCFAQWGRCPTCRYNQHLTSSVLSQYSDLPVASNVSQLSD